MLSRGVMRRSAMFDNLPERAEVAELVDAHV